MSARAELPRQPYYASLIRDGIPDPPSLLWHSPPILSVALLASFGFTLNSRTNGNKFLIRTVSLLTFSQISRTAHNAHLPRGFAPIGTKQTPSTRCWGSMRQSAWQCLRGLQSPAPGRASLDWLLKRDVERQ